jgi:hypothetical protein
MTPAATRAETLVSDGGRRSPSRWRDIVASFVFVVAIAAMGIAAFVPRDRAALDGENRAAAHWPAPFTVDFTHAFERAFADRFGARDALLRLHHRVLVRAFDVSPAHNVLLGRDGWLYYKGEEGTSFDTYYRGTVPMAYAYIARVAAELARRHAWLAAHDVAYVVTIAPDKATIYPEHLPRWATRTNARAPSDRLADALRAAGVPYADLRAPLMQAKARERVYYMTDSHWNYLGARVAYRAIMTAIAAQLAPAFVAIAPVALPPYEPERDVYAGDLARMTGDGAHFREADIAPLGKVLATPQSRCAQRVDSGDEPDVERYACARAGVLPSLLAYRDSMAIPLIPMLSENFARSTYVSSHRLDPARVLRERPTVVVEEMVERSMLGPIATPMPTPP